MKQRKDQKVCMHFKLIKTHKLFYQPVPVHLEPFATKSFMQRSINKTIVLMGINISLHLILLNRKPYNLVKNGFG